MSSRSIDAVGSPSPHARGRRRLETAFWSGPGESLWRVSSFGRLNRVRHPPHESDRWVLISYALGVFEEGEKPDYEAGNDVRWRPAPQLGVDLTLNPDFALVEADVEEINPTRFELRVLSRCSSRPTHRSTRRTCKRSGSGGSSRRSARSR
jgi:hypothetical protein